ncbi:hypothetical protein D3C83_43340 [compost metagenome]
MVHDAVLFRHLDPLQPLGKSLRHVLLPEPLLADSRRIPLHRHRPPAQVRQDRRRDRFVVGRQLALRDPVVRKEHFFGMGNDD